MKKLILITALCFASTITLAQNNSATVVQENNNNSAIANQSGSNNTATLLQQVKNNDADIDQIGGGNFLQNSINGNGNPLYAIQRASSFLYLDQIGDNNIVGLYQNNQKNAATIHQIGNLNNADVSQVAFGGVVNGNDTYLWQEGTYNKTQVRQGISGGNHSDNYVNIEVLGNNNGNSGQGSAGDDWMLVEQYGDFNNADIEIEGNNNDVDVYQAGDNNDASSDVFNASSNNEVNLTQMNGNANRASYRIGDGQNNNQALMQDGSQNRSHVQILSGADDNISMITQTGINNRGLWVISGGNTYLNSLTVATTGDDNKATGLIKGNNNTILLTQTGFDNLIGISGQWNAKDGVVVDGDLNTITITQTTNLNQADVNITGNNNTATISQN
ncbi:hypothetical protein AB2B38_001805 [Balneola sp. MJW-20]|uniref:hypothetical protein n=1 Tax=Gracilimonas aurantiaca TaxID=3234185 RepID=UPI0034674AFF